MKKLINLILFYTTLLIAQTPNHPNVAVVLSGGGLRGTGHIGVLRALEEKNIKIDLIVGSSVGALIGGLYCAGYKLDQIEKFLFDVNWEDIYNDAPNRSDLFLNRKSLKEKAILQIRFSGSGAEIPKAFSSGQKLRSLITKKVLQSPIGNRQNFDQYKIPLRIVATNFINGEKTIFDKGDLAEIIHASVAVPLLYEPVQIDSFYYVDGGLSDNLPIDVARNMGAELIIASDLTSPLRTIDKLNAPWDIADQVTGIMMQTHIAQKRDKADILIRPNLNNQEPGDWDKLPETIIRSYQSALHTLDQYQDTLSFYNALRNESFYTFNNLKIQKSLLPQLKFGINTPDSNEVIGKICRQTLLFIDSLKNSNIQVYDIGSKIDQIFVNNNCPYIQAQYSLNKDSLILKIVNTKIRNIKISGNKHTKELVIRRELELLPDETINYSDLNSSYDNIYNTDLFTRVGMHLIPVKDSKYYDLEIKVSEKKSNLMQLGLRYDNTRFSKSFLEFSNQNIFGYGFQNSILLELGEIDRGVKLDFNSERLGYTKITTGAEIQKFYHEKRRFDSDGNFVSYDENRSKLGLYFGWQIERFGRVVLWGVIENLNIHYKDIYPSRQFLFSKIHLSSEADRRNSKVYPQHGNNNVWALDIGHYESSNTQAEFVKFFLQLSEWYSLHKNHNIGALFQSGLADNNVPYEEFFEWGGWDKMPGFIDRENAGRTFWLLRFDYRYHIPFDFPGSYYFHLGIATGKSSKSSENYLKFDNLINGGIAGISVQTLAGPLGIFYGYNDSHAERIYFSLGFPF